MSDVVCEVIAQLQQNMEHLRHMVCRPEKWGTSCSTGQRRYRRRRTSFMPCAF